jgi:hypothetical protein
MKIDINKLFLVFLPFTQALTINIFFPLKISEIALVVLLLFYLNKKVISYSSIWFCNSNKIILLFSVIVTLSFIVNIYWDYSYSPKIFPFRINRVGDSFIRLCYFYLCLLAYYVSFKFFIKDIKLLDKWVLGALIAAIYGWYLFIFSKLNLPYIKLPGMDDVPLSLNGFIRCSTFKEGNYLGLYLILSASIAFYLKKEKEAWFLLFSVIITLSTISIVSAFVFLAFYFRRKFFKMRFLLKTVPIVVLSIFIFTKTDFYKLYIYGKIFDSSKTLTTGNFSKVDRIITGQVAIDSGLDNPFLGVGPANYGLHYDYYNHYKKIVINRNDYFDQLARRKNVRSIPNNVYLEVLSEYGVIAFVLFIVFLSSILIKSYYLKEDALTGGMLALILSLNAFPSFIMLFIWVFISIPFALEWNKRKDKTNSAKIILDS